MVHKHQRVSMERITKKWTPSLVEAYGPGASKAREAELMVIEAFAGWGYQVLDCESDFQSQKHGIDLTIKHPDWRRAYSIDVKSNMNKYGTFWVETSPEGWLRHPSKTSDRICHVCVDTGWVAWYGRDQMVEWLRKNGHLKVGLFEITTRHKIDFINKRKIG